MPESAVGSVIGSQRNESSLSERPGDFVPPGAEEFGLNVDGIEAVYQQIVRTRRAGTPSSSVSVSSAASRGRLSEGQVELTEADYEKLEQITRRDAISLKKPVRSSELQPAVLGHNQCMGERTQRLLRQWFVEHRYRVDKVTNAQRQVYKQLSRLHVDKRRCARQRLHNRQEEARADMQREAERQQSRKALQELNEAMEKLKAEEGAEKKRIAAWNASRARGSLWATSSAANEVAAMHKLNRLMAVHEHEEDDEDEEDEEDDECESEETFSVSEDARDSNDVSSPTALPLADHQDESFAAERQRSGGRPELVTLTSKVLVVDRKSFQAARQGSKVSTGSGDFAEVQPLVRSRSVSFVREPTRRAPSASELPPLQPPEPRDSPQRLSERSTEASPQQRLPPIRRMTLADRNRLRAKRREAAARRALNEPFTFYRISRNGRLEPVEFSPSKFPTTEPSNRRVYEHRKRIEQARQAYIESMRQLGQHTATMEQAGATVPEMLRQRQKTERMRQEAEEARIGLKDWRRIFVHSDLPPDVEPGSLEAMRYVEYIRPDPPRSDRPVDIYEVFQDVTHS